MPIDVKTEVFEGPLNLLLELIEKRKLLINDISLAKVADEYIARLNAMEEVPVGEVAEFVALAATLLLIKSRSLLPQLALSEDESRDIKQLEYRLACYQILKEAARELVKVWGGEPLYEGAISEPEPIFVFDPTISFASLGEAARALIESFPTPAALPAVAVKKMLSLEEAVEDLAARISSAFQLSFKQFSGHAGTHIDKEARQSVIVNFLALLELVKQGIIKANQSEDFGDILLEQDAVAVPHYG